MIRLGWPAALAWRLRRHRLELLGSGSVADVVHSLGAVADTAGDASIRARMSGPADVAAEIAQGSIVRTFAFRGAVHLMTPADAQAYLRLRAAGRVWERTSWQTHYGLAPADWPRFRETVREALAAGPLTRDELSAAVTARPEYRHLGFAFADPSYTLLKPLAWLGAMSFGPPRDGRATFQRLDWPEPPDLDDAGRWAVTHYFRSYGPATPNHLHYWLGGGLGAGRSRIASWIAVLGPRLVEVEVGGEARWVLREDLDELAAARPTTAVRLLPGYDPWVLGPGTADPHVVPPAKRALVTGRANLVTVGGVVSGTWVRRSGEVVVTWFDGVDRPVPPEAAARVQG